MAACKVCDEPLVLHLEPEEEGDEPLSYPDDLELPCGCHFHWQCLLDQSSHISSTFRCPSCDKSLEIGSSSLQAQKIITKYTNEGGAQENVDILPDIKEEVYLESHPEARPARAFHVMCAEGDVGGIVELLRSAAEEADEQQLAQMMRYQDPLAGKVSALHLAVENFREETVWLLLWLASPLPTESFPKAARREAESVGMQRSTAPIGDDIRSLKNEGGQTPADIARNIGGIWQNLPAGVLE